MRDFFTEEIGKIREMVSRDPAYSELEDEKLREKIDEMLELRMKHCMASEPETAAYYTSISFRTRKSLEDTIFESIRGLGILGKIIGDKSITEVMINGYDTIFVERDGRLEQIPDKFESKEKLRNIITKFVQDMGRSINESNPIVDARLKNKDDDMYSRVNVVLDPVALNGPIVTIRRFPEEGMTIQKLINYGSLTPQAAAFLEKLVRAKYNIFISGGTGSGKTTFLNALSNFIPSAERVITIEDSAELQIRNVDNLVRLETRNAGPDGSGAITIKDLIKSALRMRPDRIVVGEVRGAEALDMLQAMNTGHDGSLSTGHANSTYDMISRLETMVLQGAAGLPLEAIRQQIASAVDIIIHLSRLRDKSRKTMEIVEILGYNPVERRFETNTLYEFIETSESTKEKVIGKLVRTGKPMKNTQKLENAGIYRKI